jgi:hypothetical protein
MEFERIHFAPGEEPEVFTMNMCERFFGDKHEDCPGWMKYDPARMVPREGKTASEDDTVFCICPCHRKPQA